MAFFLGGGFPMVFIALFGALAIAHAARFAIWPDRSRIAAILAYAGAVVFAGLAGVCVDLSVVGRNVAQAEVSDEMRPLIVLVGFAESMAPAILGFSIAAVVCLLIAAGLRRSSA